jgi:hypothetical protein
MSALTFWYLRCLINRYGGTVVHLLDTLGYTLIHLDTLWLSLVIHRQKEYYGPTSEDFKNTKVH